MKLNSISLASALSITFISVSGSFLPRLLVNEFKVDISHFKMIAEFYDRKCPCWGGKHSCPCPPFAETKNCACGAVRALDDVRAQKPGFMTYKVDFSILSEVINNEYECPSEKGKRCFCQEFLETGNCKLSMFQRL